MTTRTPLRRDLADLKQKVYMLGEKCIEVSDLYNSLIEGNSESLQVRLNDTTNEVKKESKELNDQCFLVLTLQQPMIKDLRFVIGSLQIVLNLQKITELYSSGVPLISDLSLLDQSVKDDLLKMANKVHDSLQKSLTLYLSSNLANDLLNSILAIFAETNYLHDILYKHILKEVAKVTGQKAQIEAQLLSTIRSLEKISDLTQSIVEQVNYIIIGRADSEKVN